MAAIRITKSGVKQHKATKTVPVIAANSPFFDVFGEILTIRVSPIIYMVSYWFGYEKGTPNAAPVKTSIGKALPRSGTY